MIAVDTNVLVHAFVAEMPSHHEAKTALSELAQSTAAWAIPWPCIHEFYGVVTNPRLFAAIGLSERALTQIAQWMQSPSLELLGESPNHWRTIQHLIRSAPVTGPRVHDAKIAAICIDRGVSEILTLDRDFTLFGDLRVRSLSS